MLDLLISGLIVVAICCLFSIELHRREKTTDR